MSNTRKIRESTAIASATLIAGATAFGIAGCNSTSTTAAPPPATTTAPAAAATPASDTQVCNDVNTWEQNNDGQAASSFGTDAASQAIVQEASGSSAVDADVQSLSSDSGSSSAAADITSLAADCAAAGVTLTGSDFSQAAPAPSTPAPAFTPATLLNTSGSGGYTTQRFTVGGSGDYDVKWSYSEGSFGQSVNFQLWADGGSDINFTDPNQLGTGGSGTVHVYGDAGTHSITVNTEGDWTISVVTTP